jgi:hypothetical protein
MTTKLIATLKDMISKTKLKLIKRLLMWLIYTAFVLIALLIIFIAMTIHLRTWIPFLDDGPFHGKPCTYTPKRAPNQTFPIYNNMTLEVFDPKKDDIGPIVRLRNKENEIQWSIWVTAKMGEKWKAYVGEVRFHDYGSSIFYSPRVRGSVIWTFGHEAAWWVITKEGELEGYWFSW